jgi:hypothetical protein
VVALKALAGILSHLGDHDQRIGGVRHLHRASCGRSTGLYEGHAIP